MAKYWVDSSFTFTDSDGSAIMFDPKDRGHIFDTTNPALNLPAGWTPPAVGLRPMDSAAQAALATAIAAAQGAAQATATTASDQPPGIEVEAGTPPIFNP
jgi:hypothetical protein